LGWIKFNSVDNKKFVLTNIAQVLVGAILKFWLLVRKQKLD